MLVRARPARGCGAVWCTVRAWISVLRLFSSRRMDAVASTARVALEYRTSAAPSFARRGAAAAEVPGFAWTVTSNAFSPVMLTTTIFVLPAERPKSWTVPFCTATSTTAASTAHAAVAPMS